MCEHDASRLISKFIFSLGIVGVSSGMFLDCQPVRAELSREDYLATLKIADQYVQRRKQMSTANALSSTMLMGLMGRYYKVGDTWEVIAYRSVPTAMRMTNDPEQLRPGAGDVGVFRYQVV